MTTPLHRTVRVLLLEDTTSDVEFTVRELQRGGLDFVLQHVETLEAFEASLDEFAPDVVLADYHLAGFDGVDALRLSRSRVSPPPFIFVSGSIGEERAVEALREGAADYVMKDRLGRLPTAVVQAVAMNERILSEQRAREALQQSEERFRLVARVTSDGIWDWNPGTGDLWISDSFRGIFGYAETPERVPVDWWSDRIHPEDKERMTEVVDRILSGSELRWRGEYRFRRANGTWAEIADHVYVVRDSQGGAVRLIGAIRDISGEKAAARALHESEKRFRSVTQTAKDAILIVDKWARISFRNNAAEEMFGQDGAMMIGTPVAEFLAFDVHEHQVMAALKERSTHRAAEPQPVAARNSHGRTFPVEISVSHWNLDQEEFFTVVARDVSERERQQARQSLVAEVLRDMLNAPTDDIAPSITGALEKLRKVIGTDTAWAAYLSDDRQSVEDFFEWSPPEIASTLDMVRGAPAASFAKTIQSARRPSGVLLRVDELMPDSPERRLMERAGVRASLCVAVVRDEEAIGVVGTDSTDAGRMWDADDAAVMRMIGEVISSAIARKRAVDRLARSETMLSEAQRLAAIGSWERNLLTGEIRWSDEMFRIHGFEPGSFAPSIDVFFELIHPEDRDRIMNAWKSPEGDLKPVNFEYRIIRADQHHRILQGTRTPVFNGSGKLIQFLGIAQDVTERLLLERQVDQAERVAGLGRMAATIAHEFNNVLMGIQPFAELLERRLPKNESRLESAVASILNSVKRGRNITGDILRFTRPSVPAPATLEVDPWLRRVVDELQAVIGERVQITVRNGAAPLSVRVDQQQLVQVFSNLILNARDAMPKGGTITISVHPPLESEVQPFGLVHDVSSRVLFTIADEGEGIPPHVLPNIFDPLFTTKRNGTGIGLAVVHQIIEKHQGQIFVESEPGKGTRFHLFLPLA